MSKMSRATKAFIFILSFLALATYTYSSFASPQAQGSSYYVASMDLTIDAGAEDFIKSSIADATAVGANHFILVMNTFGGEGDNMDHIITAITDYESSGNVFITLIAPAGRHAFSAGAYIAEASNEVYMVPGTAIGSATPIITGIPGEEINSTLTKDINGFKAYMVALTSRFGRNTTATALMVTKGQSFTAEEASHLHVITGLINSSIIQDALNVIGVPTGMQIHTPGIRSTTISVLTDPNVSALLFLVGVFAILADLYHPTLVLSIVGAAAIALALVGLGVFGASFASLILMLIGAAFIFLEVKTHHGISALIGVVVFAIGFLLIFRTPSPPPQIPQGLPPPANFIGVEIITYIILGVLGGGIVIGSLYLYRIREAIRQRPKRFDTSALVGRDGYLTSDLKAGGLAKANIASEEWTVTSEQDLPKGTAVKVKEVRGLKLVVERKV
jgi:membrane-bound serine protease (ClpP class)